MASRADAESLTATMEGKWLTVKVLVNDPPVPSATGKTLVVASSKGNMQTTVEVNGQPVIIGLNAYIYPGKK